MELAAGIVACEGDRADLAAALGQDQGGGIEGGLGIAYSGGDGGRAGGDADDVAGGEAADNSRWE